MVIMMVMPQCHLGSLRARGTVAPGHAGRVWCSGLRSAATKPQVTFAGLHDLGQPRSVVDLG
jgi:hypothetical protein